MTVLLRLIPIAAAAALAIGATPAAQAGAGFDPAAVVQVGERHWHRHHHHYWGPPGHWRRLPPPPVYYYAPPPRVYYPPPRVYYAPPPPRYYYAPQPSVGLYFRF